MFDEIEALQNIPYLEYEKSFSFSIANKLKRHQMKKETYY